MATQMSPGGSGGMICFFIATIFCQPLLAKLPLNFQHVLEVTDPPVFKASEGLKMLFYFIGIPTEEGLDTEYNKFLSAYDESAHFLKQYNYRVGMVDCLSVPDPDCQEPSIGSKIFLYHDDELLSTQKRRYMFDIDSIGSAALQAALHNVVLIAETKSERLVHMVPLQGKTDVVVAYFPITGIHVHRVFLEVASAFYNKVQFMLAATERSVSDLEMLPKTKNTVWFFKCKDMPPDSEERKANGNCRNILYRGEITLASFSRALRLFTGPKHFYLPEDGFSVPCHTVHCIYLYYDDGKKDKMIEVADLISSNYQGSLATVLVNLESREIRDLFLPTQDLPTISLAYAGDDDQLHFKEDISKDNLFGFINEALSNAPNTSETIHTSEDMVLTDNDFTLTDADEVSLSLSDSRRLDIDLCSLTALTDRTFAEAEISPNLTLVLFYKHCDPVGSALLQHLSEWRDNNKALFPDLSLAYVNCFDWTDVCSKQVVLHSPTVRLIGHQRGQDIRMDPERTYKGALNPKDIVSFFFTYRLNGVLKIEANEANEFLSGKFRGVANLTSHCLLGLFHEQSYELEEFELVSKEQRGQTLYALMTGTGAETFAQTHSLTLPTVLALRWDDPLVPISHISGPINKKTILEFSKSSKIPLFPELEPGLLPSIYRTKRPLLILFWKSPDPSYSTLKNLVESGDFKNVIFTWLNLIYYTNFGVHLVETYFSVPSLPALSMVYFSENVVYNFEGKQITEETVRTWIEKLTNHRDSMEPSYRMKHNDFKPIQKAVPFNDKTFDDLENQTEDNGILEDQSYDDLENVKTERIPEVSTIVPEGPMKAPVHAEL